MSNTSAAAAAVETRQAMMRVWMAISAIWVTFWLCFAALIVVAGGMNVALEAQFGLFALIVLTPPFALLAIGTAFRCGFEALFRNGKDKRSESSV